MDSTTDSKADGDGGPVTSQLKPSHTSKKPLTKPVGPRLSNVTRSTSASSARLPTTSSTPNTINKPPTRPPLTNRRQTPSVSSIASTADTSQQKRLSISSLEGKTSGDEARREGLSVKPKRISVSSPTTSERSTSMRGVTSTPTGGTSVSTLSRNRPTSTSSVSSKSGLTTSTRSTVPLTRTRPLSSSSSSLRNATSLLDRKRLSTIPASPAVKLGAEELEDNKENARLTTPGFSGSEWTQDEDEKQGSETSRHPDTAVDGDDNLREELLRSQQKVEQLEEHIAALSLKLEESDRNPLTNDPDEELEVLQKEHQDKIADLLSKHDEELKAQTATVMRLKAELEQRDGTHSDDQNRSDADRIAELEQELQAAKDNARSTLNDLRDDLQLKFSENETKHEIQISQLNAKLAQAESDLALRQSQFDASGTAQALDLEKINNEVARQSQVITTLQGQISAFQRSKDEVTQEKDSIINQLKESISEVTQSKAKELESAEHEMTNLRADHVAKLKLIEKQRESTQKALESQKMLIKEESAAQLKTLTDDLAAAQSELQKVMSSHKTEVDKLQSQLSIKEQEISKQKDENAKEVAGLLTRLESSSKDLDSTYSELKEHLVMAQTELAKSETEFINLQSTSSQQLRDQHASLSAKHENAIATLRNSHAEQIHALELQSKSALKDLEGLELAQNERLKQTQDKAAALHREDLERVAVNHRSQINDLSRRLEEANVTLSEHNVSSNETIRRLEAQGKTTRSDLEAARFQVENMRNVLVSVEENARQKEQSQQTSQGQLRSEIEQLRKALEQRSVEIRDLAATHESNLQNQKSRIADEHKLEVGQLMAEHTNRCAEMESRHLAAMERLDEDHKKSANESSSQIARQMTDRVDVLQAEHLKMTSELLAKQEKEDNATKQQILKLQTELDKSRNAFAAKESELQALQKNQDNSKDIKELEDRLHKAESDYQDTQQNNKIALEAVKEGHAVEVAQLKLSLSELAAKLSDSEATASKHAKVREKVVEYESMVSELKRQLEHARTELELQRKRADNSETMVKEFQQMRDTSESSGSTDINHVAEAQSVSDTKGRSGSKTPPKAGLSSSKWAVPETQQQTDNGLVAASAMTPIQDIHPTTAVPSTTTSGKKFSIEAKLAGIQEQIRQLNDISSDCLQDHEQMAKTLNRHANEHEYSDNFIIIENEKGAGPRNGSLSMLSPPLPRHLEAQGREDGVNGRMESDGDSQNGIVEVEEDISGDDVD